ncbi:MAG TPA: hypothetical protein VH559_00265 [Gemmatimonadaceae bacterium]
MTSWSLLHPRARATVAALVFALQAACGGGDNNGCPVSSPNCQTTPTVVSVAIANAPGSFGVGDAATLAATVVVTNGASQAVTWSSSNPNVVGVLSDGNNAVVTGVATGTATITAKAQADASKSASVVITVGPSSALVQRWTANRAAPINGPSGEIAGMWGSSPSEVFAVTFSGDIARYDGSGWAIQKTGAGSLQGIHGSSGSDVWAVNAEGEIWHYNGATWTSTIPPRRVPLIGVYALNASNVFVVGDSGSAFHYNGTSWAQLTGVPNVTRPLYSVWAASPTDVYAGGASGIVYRWDGTSWSSFTPSIAPDAIFSLSGSAPNNIVGVGSNGAAFQWNGASWSRIGPPIPDSSFWAVHVLSPTEIYAIGDGASLKRYDGATWTTVKRWPLNWCLALYSFGASATYTGCPIGQTNVVKNGESSILSLSPTFWSSSVLSPTSAFLVGDAFSIMRMSGTTWTPVSLREGGAYLGVWAENATNVIAVGTGGIDRFDGTTTTSMLTPQQLGGAFLYGVWGANGTNVFAVGEQGSIYRYDGATWTRMNNSSTRFLVGVWGSSPTNVFTVGEAGTILRYDGSVWSPMASGTTRLLLGVWGIGNTVFAVGNGGTVLRYNGTSWSSIGPGPVEDILAVWGSSDRDVYVAGSSGVILRYNGVTWTTMQSGTTRALYTLSGAAGQGGVAVAAGDESNISMGSSSAALSLIPLRSASVSLPRTPTRGGTSDARIKIRGAANRRIVPRRVPVRER